MEPIQANQNQNIYHLIGFLKDTPYFKFHRKLFINLFENFSTELARIAFTPKLLSYYSILHNEYRSTLDGNCPFVNKSTIIKIQELLFHGIICHPKFNDLSLKEIIYFIKTDSSNQFLENFKQHPTIKNITKYKHNQIRLKAEESKDTAFLKIWFNCRPTSKKSIPLQINEREHIQIIREMRRDSTDLTLDKRKKGAFYLALENGFYNSAICHLNSMITISSEDAIFYLYKAIQTGKLEMVTLILKKVIDKSEQGSISTMFECMKNEVDIEPDRSYEKLVLKVFENKELEVLSILLIYEAIFFEDNIAEQLLEDLIDDHISQKNYPLIKSCYDFTHFKVDDLIKEAAKPYLFKWISKGKREHVLELLQNFPKCSDLILKIAAMEGSVDDFRFYIQSIDHLKLPINVIPLLKYACEENKLENMKLLIEEYHVEINQKDFKVPLINIAAANGNFEIVDFLLNKGALLHQDTLVNAIFSDKLEIVQLVLKHGVDIHTLKEEHLLKNVIRDGTAKILNCLEDYFGIDLRVLILKKLNVNWSVEILLEIIFKECKNSSSMLHYFSDVLEIYYLINPHLIEFYIKNASADQFHEKAFLISLTCRDKYEQSNFLELSKMNYYLVDVNLWGKLTNNPYFSEADQVMICDIIKNCYNDAKEI